MGRLTTQTMANYRCKLKTLRKVLPLMQADDPERVKVVRQIEKLTNQLGQEMTDLEAWLAKGPGRPRENPDLSEYKDKLNPPKAVVEQPKEEVSAEDKAKAFAEDFRRRNPGLVADPLVAELDRQLGGNTNEGTKATNDVEAVGGHDRNNPTG